MWIRCRLCLCWWMILWLVVYGIRWVKFFSVMLVLLCMNSLMVLVSCRCW